jgi:hypothetical protein
MRFVIDDWRGKLGVSAKTANLLPKMATERTVIRDGLAPPKKAINPKIQG